VGERYFISGVQLAMLTQVDLDFKTKQEIFNTIYAKQYIGNEKDLKRILKEVKK
jgi:hypothetical protein